MSDVVIDEKNFGQYFRDCRNNRPERGDVMARYMAIAEFVEGNMKRDIIDLLLNKDKAVAATSVMSKLGCATQKDAIKVCKEICEDLVSGMTAEEVEKKPYPYLLEVFYYTKREYIPENDPHWTAITLENLDQFLDKEKKVKMTAKVISKEEFKGDLGAAAE